MGSRNKQAGPGAGVEIALSGKSNKYRVNGDTDWNGEFKINPKDFTRVQGNAVVSDVTMFSYYDSVRVRGKAGYISDLEFDRSELDDWRETIEMYWEGQTPQSMTFTIAEMENAMLSGGWMRSKAPRSFEVQGYGELEVDFPNGDSETFSDIPFTGYMKTTRDFKTAWEWLDNNDDDDDDYGDYARQPKIVASKKETLRRDQSIMSDKNHVRNRAIKMAFEKPHLREKMLPLIKKLSGEFTEQEWKTHKQKFPGAKAEDHTITKGDGGGGKSKSSGPDYSDSKAVEAHSEKLADITQKKYEDGSIKMQDIYNQAVHEGLSQYEQLSDTEKNNAATAYQKHIQRAGLGMGLGTYRDFKDALDSMKDIGKDGMTDYGGAETVQNVGLVAQAMAIMIRHHGHETLGLPKDYSVETAESRMKAEKKPAENKPAENKPSDSKSEGGAESKSQKDGPKINADGWKPSKSGEREGKLDAGAYSSLDGNKNFTPNEFAAVSKKIFDDLDAVAHEINKYNDLKSRPLGDEGKGAYFDAAELLEELEDKINNISDEYDRSDSRSMFDGQGPNSRLQKENFADEVQGVADLRKELTDSLTELRKHTKTESAKSKKKPRENGELPIGDKGQQKRKQMSKADKLKAYQEAIKNSKSMSPEDKKKALEKSKKPGFDADAALGAMGEDEEEDGGKTAASKAPKAPKGMPSVKELEKGLKSLKEMKEKMDEDKKEEGGKKASLRTRVIRLAHENPELRKDLLPLLQQAKVASMPPANGRPAGEKSRYKWADWLTTDIQTKLEEAGVPQSAIDDAVDRVCDWRYGILFNKRFPDKKFYSFKTNADIHAWVTGRAKLTDLSPNADGSRGHEGRIQGFTESYLMLLKYYIAKYGSANNDVLRDKCKALFNKCKDYQCALAASNAYIGRDTSVRFLVKNYESYKKELASAIEESSVDTLKMIAESLEWAAKIPKPPQL